MDVTPAQSTISRRRQSDGASASLTLSTSFPAWTISANFGAEPLDFIGDRLAESLARRRYQFLAHQHARAPMDEGENADESVLAARGLLRLLQLLFMCHERGHFHTGDRLILPDESCVV